MAKNKKENASTKVNESGASMEKIVSLCKRRGFVYPSSEIYGGLSATWDYGPLGVELKNEFGVLKLLIGISIIVAYPTYRCSFPGMGNRCPNRIKSRTMLREI